jgi:hypothetical protein
MCPILYGSYPETGFEEISGDVPEADFGLGITSGLPVIRPQSAASAKRSLQLMEWSAHLQTSTPVTEGV